MEAVGPLIDTQATRGDAGPRHCGDGDGSRDVQTLPDTGYILTEEHQISVMYWMGERRGTETKVLSEGCT